MLLPQWSPPRLSVGHGVRGNCRIGAYGRFALPVAAVARSGSHEPGAAGCSVEESARAEGPVAAVL